MLLCLTNCGKDPVENNENSENNQNDTINEFTLPVVVTSPVSEVGFDKAICGGEVTDDGGCKVTARGLCWGLQPDPCLSDNHSVDSCGMGAFSHNIIQLTQNTKYYVRAYATNEKGTSFGNTRVFTTASVTPSVRTVEVSGIDMVSAVVRCEVTSDGGSEVTERGVCWSKQPEPTLDDTHLSSGIGLGGYDCHLTDLEPNTTYYVRAYVSNSYATAYGNDLAFNTMPQVGMPQGAIDALFSVSATRQVWFSQGNLQYQASTNTWRFADQQYEALGLANEKVSPDYSGWIDMFGWGTSGYDHGAVCYQPWSTSTNYYNYVAYDDESYGLYDGSGQADWGYNPISNGGNLTNIWRTLTQKEWEYVFEWRSTQSDIRFAKAVVNEMNGVLLLPDDWDASMCSLSHPNDGEADYTTNIINASDWSVLEEAGAVFLPAAGGRSGATVNAVGTIGCYWSSSPEFGLGAYSVDFLSDYLGTDYVYVRYMGNTVRLVCTANL